MKTLLCVLASFAAALIPLSAQVTLTGTSYTQNFNTISNGLPTGWSVRTGSTASSLGATVAFTGGGISWGDTGGAFKNFAGPIGNGGTVYTGGESLSVQGSTTNRTLGIRPTGSFGEPGAGFVFQLANTLGYENFQLSLDFNLLSHQGRSMIWKLEYGLGNSPATFTQVGTDYTDPGAFGVTTKTFTFPAAIADQNQNVWIRIVTLATSTGSGNRDSFGIDNFHLTYSVLVPPTGPPVISTHPQGQTVWKGTNVTFTVAATGAAPLSYQWFHNDSALAGKTTATLALSNVTSANAGTYRVEVTNPEDTVSSEPALLTVQSPVVTTIGNLRSLVDPVNWLPPTSDTIYEVEGFVTTRGNLGSTGNVSFYLQDATGGINVFVSGGTLATLYKDRVRVTGRLSHFNGLLQLLVEQGNPTHKYLIFGPSTPLGPPIHLQFATQFDVAAIEALEGSLVVISNVYIDATTPNFTTGTTLKMTNAFNPGQTFDLRIDARVTEFQGKPKPLGVATVIGVLSQNALTNPRTNGYQILPTSYYDEIFPGPQITSHPQHKTVILGESANFSVSALNHGIGALRYQWRKSGVNIPGATTSTYSINATALSDNAEYSVVVGNDYATTPSAGARLGVGTGSVSVMHYNVKGNFAEDFSAAGTQVQAIGRQLAYLQPDIITFNEIPVGKAHVVTNLVHDFLPGYAWATNSGTDGAIRSAILSRWRVLRSESWLDGAPLSAFGHPENFTRDLFEAEIDVPGYVQPLHVFTTHLKSGSGSDECLKRAAEAGAISNYFVNGFLTTNSGRSYLLTGDLNEDINRPPASSQGAIQAIRNSATGLQLTTPLNPFTLDDRTFSVQAPPLDHRYDYVLPSSGLTGQISTSQVFRTSVLAPLPPGLNANDDSTASDHLPVLVQFNNPSFVPPIFLTQPENRISAPGTPVSFTVEVASATTVSYQWKKDEVELLNAGNVSGANTATLNLASISGSDVGLYSVVASNIYGVVTSDTASLSIAIPPAISSEPAGSTNVAGTTASFTVAATGTDPLSYQWKKNNAPLSNGGRISGADSATLVITGLVTSDDGAYSVTVTNLAGSVESASAQLAVITAPTITSHPTSRTIAESTTSVLTVSATGTSPLAYQWHFNAAPISGATDSSYSIVNAAASHAGNYFVVVSNFAGPVSSSVALVKVALSTTPLQAANLVVLRLGDSVQAMANTGNSAYLDQFTTSGDYVSTMSIPDSGSSALILAGGTTSEGALSRSANGIYLTFAGYNTPRPASNSVASTTSATVPRVVGQVNAVGTYTTPAQTLSQYSANPIRGAVSDGANNYWAAGQINGTQYLGNEGAAGTVQNAIANTRVVNVFNGNLYFSTGSGTRGIYRISGTPTSATPATLLFGTGANSSPYGFAINSAESLAYVADDSSAAAGGGIQRWDLVDGIWVKAAYTLSAGGTGGARGIVVDFSGANPIVYATTGEGSANRIIQVIDLGAGSAPVTLANAGANQVFRGIQFGPETPEPVAIVAGPGSLNLLQGESATFSVTATGTGPLRYQWSKDGLAIGGATSSAYSIPAVQPGDAGNYAVSVSNMVNVITTSEANLTVAADPIAPVLKVANPKANSIHLDSSILIQGTVVETVRLKSVEYNLNSTSQGVANVHFAGLGKASNWNATINLNPGTNELVVTATDLAGNTMSVGPLKFYYHTPSALVIQTNLNGAVITTNGVGAVVNTIPASLYLNNNTNLYVGRTYTLKALETGAPSYILTNWTATWTGNATPVVLQTNNLTCTFEMKEGMVISANYISNPFYRFGGVYNGLFSESTGVEFESAGFITVKVTPKLTFSAKLLVDGNSVSIAGKLKLDGTGTGVSKTRIKADKPELTLNLALDFAGQTDTVSGTVVQPVGLTYWTANLLAHRSPWNLTNNFPTTFTNSYTMLIPGFDTAAEGPSGTGSASIRVDIKGKAITGGVAADMQAVKQTVLISKDGWVPFFSPMYKVKRPNALAVLVPETEGFVMGWLQLTNNGGVGPLAPAGQLHWIKTGWTNSTYAVGFTNAAKTVQGSLWSYDALAPQNALAGLDPVLIDFTEGDLGAGFSNTWDVTVKSTFAPIKGNIYAHGETAAIVPKTGVFKGKFTHPSDSSVTKYQGAILQNTLTGAGTFMGPTNGGNATLGQAPAAQ